VPQSDTYHSLEENLAKLGFERAENSEKRKLAWRWQVRLGDRSNGVCSANF
jgi:hypothetical protein